MCVWFRALRLKSTTLPTRTRGGALVNRHISRDILFRKALSEISMKQDNRNWRKGVGPQPILHADPVRSLTIKRLPHGHPHPSLNPSRAMVTLRLMTSPSVLTHVLHILHFTPLCFTTCTTMMK